MGIVKMLKLTVSNMLYRLTDRSHQGHKIKSLKAIGIDEIYYKKGSRGMLQWFMT